MRKPDYGFDAPGIMRMLLLTGLLGTTAAIFLYYLARKTFWKYPLILLLLAGSVMLILGLMMLAYGLKGKFNVRRMMLSRVDWKGDEQVLDVGTGTGLLMNGAAAWLSAGKCIGIDVWREEDLSGNSMSNALLNAQIEGVSDRIEIRTEDARKLNFATGSFDVVLSLFCLHNIEDKVEQEQACWEIARVLRPGGKTLIGDYLPTHQYAKAFEKAGMTVVSSKSYFAVAYGPMWMVEAVK